MSCAQDGCHTHLLLVMLPEGCPLCAEYIDRRLVKDSVPVCVRRSTCFFSSMQLQSSERHAVQWTCASLEQNLHAARDSPADFLA